MTKDELKIATGQELIEQRNYCGVDGYYGDYLDNVNEEMLRRFNRLAELEQENAQAKEIIKELLLLPYANNEEVYADVTSTLDKAEQFLKEIEK